MNEYTEECLKTFLKKQGQLFDEPVAGTMEEAEDFLEDCMAVVVDSLQCGPAIIWKRAAMDASGMSDEELEETAEVFALEDGTYLIVEG